MAMAQSRLMQGVIASDEPLIVTALSVEPGNISLATWIDAPVDYNKYYYKLPNLKTEPSRGGFDSCIQMMWLQSPSTLSQVSPLYPAIRFSTVDQLRHAGLEGERLQQHYKLLL